MTAAEAQLSSLVSQGHSQGDAWSRSLLVLLAAAESHCTYFMLNKFVGHVEKQQDADVKRVMGLVCTCFALQDIKEGKDWIGLLDKQSATRAQEALGDCLAAMRPEAAALADAFDIPDSTLNSALGR